VHPKQASQNLCIASLPPLLQVDGIAMTSATLRKIDAGVAGPIAEGLNHELPPVNLFIAPIFLLLVFEGALQGPPRSRR
jgi:hypothetical protein